MPITDPLPMMTPDEYARHHEARQAKEDQLAEREERARKARYETMMLNDLLVGEEYWIGDFEVLRVIGGWIYTKHEQGNTAVPVSSVFVPLPEEPVYMEAALENGPRP